MADLNQFLNPGLSADDVSHSTSYGAVAGGGGAGGLSMDQRRKILNQPRVVGAYQYSRLGRQASAVKSRTADQKQSRTYDASSDTFSDKAGFSNRKEGGLGSTQVDTKSIEKREHYIEPPTRKFDKFG